MIAAQDACCSRWILDEKEKDLGVLDVYMMVMQRRKNTSVKKGVRVAVVAIYYVLNTSTLGGMRVRGCSTGLRACENGLISIKSCLEGLPMPFIYKRITSDLEQRIVIQEVTAWCSCG